MIDNTAAELIPATDPAELDRLHQRLVDAAAADGSLDVVYRTVDSPLGLLLLAATDQGLVRLAYEREDHDHVLQTLVTRVSPRILRAPGRLDEAARQLDAYFAGSRRTFDLPVDLRLSTGFRRQVLDHLRTIGYGHTETYTARGGRDRPAPRCTRRWLGLRHQPGSGGRALPPGAPVRRNPGRICGRLGGQAHAARPGTLGFAVGPCLGSLFTL